MITDTRGGGSELNDACIVNTDIVVIPSALTNLDMTQALSTFEHVIETHQSMNVDISTGLLMQRVPVGRLTVSQRNDLEELSKLPMFETKLHARDAFAALGKRGLLHKTYEALKSNPMKQISAGHMVTAIEEAKNLANDINEELGS
jgi:cellulose biosynthesis protein BcsQ